MGGVYIPRKQRQSRVHTFDHPLWMARQAKDKELFDAVQKEFNSKKKHMPDNGKAFFINLTKRTLDMNHSFIVMRYRDFADLCIGTPAGERNLERESEILTSPLGWALLGHED